MKIKIGLMDKKSTNLNNGWCFLASRGRMPR